MILLLINPTHFSYRILSLHFHFINFFCNLLFLVVPKLNLLLSCHTSFDVTSEFVCLSVDELLELFMCCKEIEEEREYLMRIELLNSLFIDGIVYLPKCLEHIEIFVLCDIPFVFECEQMLILLLSHQFIQLIHSFMNEFIIKSRNLLILIICIFVVYDTYQI